MKSFLDPVLNPLLVLDSLVAIILISVVLSAIITILYKYLTDQTLMKSLRDQLKQFQQQMKEHKGEPEKMMAIQKKSMEVNMKYMMQSFKPMLFTFIPIILIFGWLNAHLAYVPIMPGEEFTTSFELDSDIMGNITIIPPENIEVSGNFTQQTQTEIDDGWLWDSEKSVATWTLKTEKEGNYLLEYKYKDKTFKKEVIITKGKNYAEITKYVDDDEAKGISINNEKMKPLSIKGYGIGWIWTYILFSIVTNLVLKKILKIH